MTAEQRLGWRANKARDQVHIQPSLEKTHRGMRTEPRDKGRRVCVKTRRRHLKSLGPKCKYPPRWKSPAHQAWLMALGVITRDYWRYAANYISFFLFFSRARRRLERKEKKTVYTSFEQVAQRKHSWVDVDLEWNAGQIFPFQAFFIVFFFFGSFFSPV